MSTEAFHICRMMSRPLSDIEAAQTLTHRAESPATFLAALWAARLSTQQAKKPTSWPRSFLVKDHREHKALSLSGQCSLKRLTTCTKRKRATMRCRGCCRNRQACCCQDVTLQVHSCPVLKTCTLKSQRPHDADLSWKPAYVWELRAKLASSAWVHLLKTANRVGLTPKSY